MSAFLAFRTAAVTVFRPRTIRIACLHPTLSVHAKPEGGFNDRHPSNDKIKHPVVQVVDNETGRLGPPVTLRSILDSLDLKVNLVRLMSAEPAPIVKIMNKTEEYEKRKQAKAKAKLSVKKNVQKEVQLTWGTADGDLGHKLNRIKHDLEQGIRVDLVFAPKKRQPLPTPEERQKRVQEAVDMLSDVSREWKDRDFQKTMTVVYLRGIAQEQEVLMEAEPAATHKAIKGRKPQTGTPPGQVQDLFQD